MREYRIKDKKTTRNIFVVEDSLFYVGNFKDDYLIEIKCPTKEIDLVFDEGSLFLFYEKLKRAIAHFRYLDDKKMKRGLM